MPSFSHRDELFCLLVCRCVQVGGLTSENVRWAEAIESFKRQERTLCGDVLLITAFISYLGYFTKRYRLLLMDDFWRPYLSQLEVRGHTVKGELFRLQMENKKTSLI